MNKTYQPRVGTIPYEIIEVLKANPHVTYTYVENNISPRQSASSWDGHAIWNAMKSLLKRGVVTRTEGINPSTNRTAYLYKLA